MDILITPKETLPPTPMRKSEIFPDLYYIGDETDYAKHLDMPPLVVLDNRILASMRDYFVNSFNPSNRVEVGMTFVGSSEIIPSNNVFGQRPALWVRGFRVWQNTERNDIKVGINFEKDIRSHVDISDEKFGDVLGTAHLHPEWGPKPSKADFQTNHLIHQNLSLYLPERKNPFPPFFIVYDARRQPYTHSISIHMLMPEAVRENNRNPHTRLPVIYSTTNDNLQVNFYDPSRK